MMTPSQKHAIDSDSRDILCIAGAGSGKTATMVARIERLLNAGADPTSFLVLTFTRRAARQMRERIEAKGHSTEGMLCNTFHSVCYSILRAYGDRIGYDTQTLSVIDTIDADALLQSTARDCGLVDGNGKGKKGVSLKSLAAYRDAQYSGQAVDSPLAPFMAAWFAHYTSERRSMNVLDFGSCLTEVNRLFTECPDVLEIYRRRIGYVFVDELQDSTDVDYVLHEWFKPSAQFFGVGDRRQAIYGFRGSRPDLMVERNPRAVIHDLRENFRSGYKIVAAANALIAHNGDTLAMPMIGATGQAGIVETLTGRTDAIVDKVCWLRQAYAPRDIAIIARRHDHLKRIEGRLVDVGIPCERVGQKNDIASDPDFRAIYCALRLLANPRDDMAFMGLRERLGIDGASYATIKHAAAFDGISHWQAYRKRRNWTSPPVLRIPDILSYVGALIRHIHCDLIDWWTSHCGDMTPAEAVEWFGTRDIHAENDEAAADAVTLLTCHAAKGLEFPVVIVAEMNEGSMPSSQGIRGGEDAIAEERRVAYVAMTRAKERLILHYRGPDHFDDPKYVKPPSRFIAEAGLNVKANAAEAAV